MLCCNVQAVSFMPSRDSNWSESDTALPHSPSPSTESASLGMMIPQIKFTGLESKLNVHSMSTV
jgi:hypothetical protein